MIILSELDNIILNLIQNPLPLIPRPFETIAQQAGCSEDQLLSAIIRLKEQGIIRRYRAQLDYKVLGRTASLITASVPESKLDSVVRVVNALPGVSHNYLRHHYFNLWFTLQDNSQEQIEFILDNLTKQTSVHFHSLPAARVYKLDVRFNPAGPSERDFEPVKYELPSRDDGVVALTETENTVLQNLQNEFPIEKKPFAILGDQSGLTNFLDVTQQLSAKGVIRRIGAVLDQYKLGYAVNIMLAAAVSENDADTAAAALYSIAAVSHCYLRRTFPGWPYNLFAMLHAGQMDDVKSFICDIAHRNKSMEYILLPTIKEFKKSPVLYHK